MAAEDIIQTVFLRFYENFESLQNYGSANFWLFRSASNEYYNYYNKNKGKSGFDENIVESKIAEFDLENYVELKEMKKLILAELDKMDYEQ